MTKVLLLENPHQSADEIFLNAKYEIERISGALNETELITRLQGVDILGIRSKTQITAQVLEACPQLSAIGAFCIGTNQIDLATASKQGVAVFNAPYSNTRSVVEMVLAELIALTRNIPQKNKQLQQGIWEKSASGAHEVRGKTLGIIGYGSIGSQLSVLAEAIGMKVVFYDIAEKLALGNAQHMTSLDELLAISDVVSLHIDGRVENTGFFTRDMYQKMKKGAIFINLARGHVANLDALKDALLSGHLAGAGVDVFPIEPNGNTDVFTNVLCGLDNVILTPHIGGSTLEAQESIGTFVSQKLTSYWAKGETDMSVNIPNIAPTKTSTAQYRLGWIHQNTPGALAKVNQLFANEGTNIVYQSLATAGEYGYMIMDADSTINTNIMKKLERSDAHIKLRLLKSI